eukprot:TRINITY_DN26539_c0_g1_i1.p1 TRINITY_DN26539_c0_g1~~TRINITY_DN26539_c0_g1_i1.p1  ORF type:complete len:683 (+),score=235.76 TRINITY_DN26539_c0_g1_i1:46-2049(+)
MAEEKAEAVSPDAEAEAGSGGGNDDSGAATSNTDETSPRPDATPSGSPAAPTTDVAPQKVPRAPGAGPRGRPRRQAPSTAGEPTRPYAAPLAPVPPRTAPGGRHPPPGAARAIACSKLAEFAVDEAYFTACRLKGVLNPAEELRRRDIAEFEGPDVDAEIARRRCDAAEDIRQRKLLLVLQERQRILRKGSVAQSPQSGQGPVSPSARSRSSISSLRRPSLCAPGQTDLIAQVDRHTAFVERHLESQLLAQRARAERESELDRRRDAAYRNLKMQHVMDELQRKAVERENERLLWERARAAEAALARRQVLRDVQDDRAELLRRQIANKETVSRQALEQQRAEEQVKAHQRKLKHAVRELSAGRVRSQVNDQKRVELCRRIRGKDDCTIRKIIGDCEAVSAMEERKDLRDAYTRQVLSRAQSIAGRRIRSIEESLASRLGNAERNSEQRRDTERLRGEEAALLLEQRCQAVRERRQLEEEARLSHIGERAQQKEKQLGSAAEAKRRRDMLHGEELRLAAEKRRAMVKRQITEQELRVQEHKKAIEDRHARSEQRLQERRERQHQSRQRALYTSELIRRHCHEASSGRFVPPQPPKAIKAAGEGTRNGDVKRLEPEQAPEHAADSKADPAAEAETKAEPAAVTADPADATAEPAAEAAAEPQDGAGTR